MNKVKKVCITLASGCLTGGVAVMFLIGMVG